MALLQGDVEDVMDASTSGKLQQYATAPIRSITLYGGRAWYWRRQPERLLACVEDEAIPSRQGGTRGHDASRHNAPS